MSRILASFKFLKLISSVSAFALETFFTVVADTYLPPSDPAIASCRMTLSLGDNLMLTGLTFLGSVLFDWVSEDL